MSDRTCSVEGCEREREDREWCHTHYMRWWRSGDVQADIPVMDVETDRPDTCKIEGCERDHHARGWCCPHYKLWLKHGDTFARRPKKASDVCRIEGCEREHRARGLCNAHYKRWQRHGDPQPDKEIGRYGGDGAYKAWKLYAFHDLSYKEIAEALDISLGTVKSRIHRARRRLTNTEE